MEIPNQEPKTIELANRFMHHGPRSEAVADAHAGVRQAMFDAAYQITQLVPDGREQALALIKLEEAMMWGNAGIARGQDAEPPNRR